MPSLTYKLLKLFSELYPAWVKSLNKDLAQKKLCCDGYRKLIEEGINEDQLLNLEKWLQSANNHEYNKWPPQPLELRKLFASLIKKNAVKEDQDKTNEESNFNPDTCMPRLIALSILPLYKGQLFNEKNQHLKPYVKKAIGYFKSNKSVYTAAIKLDCIYRRMVSQNKSLSSAHILDKIFSKGKRTGLIRELEISADISIHALLAFFSDTHFNEDICNYAENSSDESKRPES